MGPIPPSPTRQADVVGTNNMGNNARVLLVPRRIKIINQEVLFADGNSMNVEFLGLGGGYSF